MTEGVKLIVNGYNVFGGVGEAPFLFIFGHTPDTQTITGPEYAHTRTKATFCPGP